MKNALWKSGILLAVAFCCLASCNRVPQKPGYSSKSSENDIAVQGQDVDKESQSFSEQGGNTVSNVDSQVSMGESSSSLYSSFASESMYSDGIPTPGQLQEKAEIQSQLETVKVYEVAQSSERKALAGDPVTVSLLLENAPLSIKTYPLESADFQGASPMAETPNGQLRLFDVSFSPQQADEKQTLMRTQVVVGEQEAFLLETPCLHRKVSDPVMVLTDGGYLVIPTSAYGVLVFSANDEERTMTHISTTLSAPGEAAVPHRLLGFLHDKEKGRFLLLHTKNVDTSVLEGTLGNMMLTVYDSAWRALEVYDTGLKPFVEEETAFPLRYTFKILASGVAAIGGPNSGEEVTISYE